MYATHSPFVYTRWNWTIFRRWAEESAMHIIILIETRFFLRFRTACTIIVGEREVEPKWLIRREDLRNRRTKPNRRGGWKSWMDEGYVEKSCLGLEQSNWSEIRNPIPRKTKPVRNNWTSVAGRMLRELWWRWGGELFSRDPTHLYFPGR